MSHLRKLGNKKWQIVIDLGKDENGKRIRKFKTVNTTQTEAKKIMERMELELLDKPGIYDNITLAEHLREWIDIYSKSIAPLTEESYRTQIEAYLIPHLGHYRLSELNTKIIDDFYTKMLKEGKIRGVGGLSKRSVRYLHVILKKALDKAIEWERLRNNPADGASPPKRARYKNKDVNPKELIKIVNSTESEYYKDIFEFALRTGLRRGEILGLMWRAVDRKRKIISVVRNLQRLDHRGIVILDLTKNKTAYTIPIGKKVIKILDRVEKRQLENKRLLGDAYLDDDLVFAKEDGSPLDPDTLSSTFSELSESMGYNYTFHDLRHGFGAIQVITGTHTKTLQQLLNHKSERTTADVYSHIIEEQKTDAAQKVDDFF